MQTVVPDVLNAEESKKPSADATAEDPEPLTVPLVTVCARLLALTHLITLPLLMVCAAGLKLAESAVIVAAVETPEQDASTSTDATCVFCVLDELLLPPHAAKPKHTRSVIKNSPAFFNLALFSFPMT